MEEPGRKFTVIYFIVNSPPKIREHMSTTFENCSIPIRVLKFVNKKSFIL